jgi:hypothetical protein
MNFTNMNIKSFINYIINFDNVDDILENCKTQSEKGCIFERLFDEAKSLLSYMKCKLPNFMLSLRKSSQDISESTCKWIPLVPLYKKWNDEEVYEYFKLTKDEIKLIKETKISGYNDIVQINKDDKITKNKKKIIL